MIQIHDNFLGENTFKALQDYCSDNEFEVVKVGDKEFRVLETPKELMPLLKIDGYEIIRSFIRGADKDFNTKLNVHTDYFIDDKKTALASVIYLSDENEVSKNGTAFWRRKSDNSIKAKDDLTAEEFNEIITEDSHDMSKWEQMDVVIGVPNRMLLYNSSYWHSMTPSRIVRGVRKVLVIFYSKL